ncbi:MAG TPA: hypothetical protein VE826_11065 [Dongiaceae bacterium]|nr:hypothetical protein [Dongiaceae bacterium]
MNVAVAVAVASGVVPAWQRDCVNALRALDDVSVRVVRAAGAPWRPASGIPSRVTGPALAPVTIPLDGDDVAGAEMVLDLTGAELELGAPLGVWSFRLGASDDAALPFAREIARGDETFEIALVRRAGERRERLRTGRFGVTAWYASTLRLALGEAARWPATLLAAQRAGARLGAEDGDLATARAPLSLLERARFGAVLAKRLGALVAEGFTEVVEWNVGFAPGGARALLSDAPLEVRWLPRPRPLSFIADPFVIERGGVRALFVEDFDYGRNRGVIDALVLDDAGDVVRRVRALDLPTHLSYPYPVELDGELYIMPENCAAQEVALYRCVEFPGRWERERAVFAFDAVDTTLFAHGGRWWAFCTRWSHGSTLSLHAFHAESPRGPWAPHALNPVVVDVTRARPAGQPFVVDGALYRPGQDCSRSYGGGVVISRIDELTPDSYRETEVRRRDGREFGRYAGGTHHVSFTRDMVVVDGKHVYRDPRKLAWAAGRLRRKIGALVTRRTAAEPSPA